MKTIRLFFLLFCACAAQAAELLGSATSPSFSVDARAVRIAEPMEAISVEVAPLYAATTVDSVRLYSDAGTLLETNSATVFIWRVPHAGTNTLTLAEFTNGVSVGTAMTRSFVVNQLTSVHPVALWPDEVRWAISSDFGGTIHYTMDGTAATSSSPIYTEPFVITNTTSVHAVAVRDDGFVDVETVRSCYGTNWFELVSSDGFVNCEHVTDIEIPDGVAEIPSHFFDGCPALERVSLPDSVVHVVADAFDECPLQVTNGCVVADNWVVGHVDGVVDAEVPDGIRGIAEGAFAECLTLETISFPSSLRYINARAFEGCTWLEDVYLPEGAVDIGESAFHNCTWVQNVTLPSTLRTIGANAFGNCTSMDRLVCQDGLESIGEGAFTNCWRMISVSLPASLTNIGTNAFRACKNLTGVTAPTHLRTMADLFPNAYTKLSSITVSEGETTLVAGVFKGCTSVSRIDLSNDITVLPDATFQGCTALSSIGFPNRLTSIGADAFNGCSLVAELDFPESLRSIGERAFRGLTRLVEVAIPADVTSIGLNAFENCTAVRRVSLPGDVETLARILPTTYASVTSAVVTAGTETVLTGLFNGCAQLRNAALPETVTNIAGAAFSGCTKLTDVALPPVLETIGTNAFYQCSAFRTVGLPETLETIGAYAFYGCSGVSQLSIPDSVETIGAYAFSGWNLLSEVALPAGLKTLGKGAFANCGQVRTVTMPGQLATLQTVFPNTYASILSLGVTDGTDNILTDLCAGCTALASVELPTSVTNIRARAFQNCKALTGVGIPSGVQSLGVSVFSGCSSLASISLPGGLKEIPDSAFSGCSSLPDVVVPDSVLALGANVFSGCSVVTGLYFVGNAPAYASATYSGTPSDVVSYVVRGSTGWDGIPTSKSLPELWPTSYQRTITYWEPNRFDVAFDANGGVPDTETLEQVTGTTYVLPQSTPTRHGAIFEGWWTEPENGARVTSSSKVTMTRAHTFYAHWRFFTYGVAFDANGGMGTMASRTLTACTPEALPGCGFVRVGYDFAGWTMEPDGAAAYGDGETVVDLADEENAVVTLYAAWTAREWNAADYLNATGLVFTTEGDAPWTPDTETSHDGIGSMRSGAIGPAEEEGGHTVSVLRTRVFGGGSGSFWWKVDCEEAYYEDYYDYVSFSIDGVEQAKIAGAVDWTKETYAVSGDGWHTLEWVFTRDDYDEDDAEWLNDAWLDEVEWTPTAVTVSFDGNGAASGEAPEAVTKYAGYEMTLPGAGTLENALFVFEGWTDGVATYAAGDRYVFGAENATLRAVWSEKVWTTEECLNAESLSFTTGGNLSWTMDFSTNHDGVVSMRSGAITHSQETWIQTTVSGPGDVSFWWKASGEMKGSRVYDYAKFEVDGTLVYRSGSTDWTNLTATVEGAGEHVLRWTYLKNASVNAGDDCAWLDEVSWTSTYVPTETTTTPVSVPYAWLESHSLAESGDYEAAAFATAANGENAVWECYVAGLDPTNPDSRLIATIRMEGDTPVVGYLPPRPEHTPAEWYHVVGKADLADEEWEELADGQRFFKVRIVVP